MTSILLTVHGAKAQAAVSGPLTSGMAGIPVKIEFDEAWNGLTKNLVCRCGQWGPGRGETRTVRIVGNTATVAHEVMRADMHLYLGIEGYSEDGKLVMPTIWANCGKIQYGANADGDPSLSPKLPFWAQLQRELDQLRQNPLPESQIGAAVENYLAEHPVKVAGAVTSVNGVEPDESGNVEIGNSDGSQGAAVSTADINIRKWFGKKIVVDGSSITRGGSGNTQPTWHSFLKDMFALDTVYNHSESGSGWFIGGGTTIARVPSYEDDADAVILMGDYNGIYNYTRGLGTIDDEPSLDGMCYARLKYLAETLISKYPLCPIIWVIEPPRASVGETDGQMVPMNPGSDYNKYSAVIEEVAEYYGFTHCNLMKNTIFRPWIQANFEAATSDGTHPWNNIQRTMAQVIAETMKRTPLIYNESYVVTPDDSVSGGTTEEDSTKTVTALSVIQNGDIFESDTLETARNYLTVKATYSDLSVSTVTDYELSGELLAETSTLTVRYGGVTTIKNVTVTAGQRTVSVELLEQNVTEGYYLNISGSSATLNGYGYTDYIPVKGGTNITFSGPGEVHGLNCGFVEYDSAKTLVRTVDTTYGTRTYALAENTAYVRCNVNMDTANTMTYVPG